MQPLCADTCGQIHKASFSSSSKDLLLVTDKKKEIFLCFRLEDPCKFKSYSQASQPSREL